MPVGSGDEELNTHKNTGSYLRLIDSCIAKLKAQGPSRTCNESKEEVKKKNARGELDGVNHDGVLVDYPPRPLMA